MDLYGPRGLPLIYTAALFSLVLFTLYRMFTRTAPSVEEQEPFIPMVRTSQAAIDMDPRIDTETNIDQT